MDSDTEQYTEQELIAIAKAKGIDEKYFQHFVTKYNQIFNQVKDEYVEEECEEGETPKTITLNITHRYLIKFIEQVEKGHGAEWAELYADSEDEEEETFNNVYFAIRKKSKEQANEELLIHCKSVEADEHYIRHFIFLYEVGDGSLKPDIKAAIYSKEYKEQIAQGKSELFAHEYADFMAIGEYTEIYCYSYAQAFESALQQNKSEEFAQLYAEKYSDYVGNHYSNMKQLEEDEDFDFYHQQIICHMKAWEYVKENKLQDGQSFINFYENIYINTYFSETRDFNLSEDELDTIILEKALEKYYHRLNK